MKNAMDLVPLCSQSQAQPTVCGPVAAQRLTREQAALLLALGCVLVRALPMA